MNTESIIIKHGVDNIFEYGFMDDFTTVMAYLEDGGNLSQIDEKKLMDSLYFDDFYCFSENKIYGKTELYKKFNVVEIGRVA